MNIIKYQYATIQDGFIKVINNPKKEIVEYNEHDFSLIETHLAIIGCDFKRSEYPHTGLYFFSVCCWLNKNSDYFTNIRKDYLGMFHVTLTYKGAEILKVEGTELEKLIGYVIINI
jgi:hypothetical protein